MMNMNNPWDNFWSKQQKNGSAVGSWSKKRMVFLLEPYLFENKRVLDAGCGSGFFSRLFCDQGLKTTALDYSEAALELAKQATAGRAKILKEDLLDSKFSTHISERFDLIFTDGLFEHFSTREQDIIMRNFLSVLAPQGIILTFVPNRWSPWQLIRPLMMPGIAEQPFVMKKLLDLNQRNGLTVVAHGGLNTLPFHISPEGKFAETFGMILYAFSTNK